MDRHDAAYFGALFDVLKASLQPYGSELGLGVFMFALVVSIQAERVIEIGRFKGFSTLALASGLRFLDLGWQEPEQHRQRWFEVDYAALQRPRRRMLYSIDPYPLPEARDLIRQNGLEQFIEFLDASSDAADLDVRADVILIDGDHSYDGCKRDVAKYVGRHLRRGGYFVLHDYFGWYDEHGNNHSPIKRVCDELVIDRAYEHMLIDTGYPSFMVFRTV